MAVKKDYPQENPNPEGSENAVLDEPIPTVEEIEILEEKIQNNTDELASISSALVNSMCVSVMMAAHCPPDSEMLHNLNVSNEAIATCVEEAAKITALLNYVKNELKNYKDL